MKQETIERLASELIEDYKGSAMARDGCLTLVRLPEVHFPPTCQPTSTTALVVLDPNKPKPDFYVKSVPAVRGNRPQHGTALVGGDAWYTFSYNLRWNEEHTATQFVEGMLRRFA